MNVYRTPVNQVTHPEVVDESPELSGSAAGLCIFRVNRIKSQGTRDGCWACSSLRRVVMYPAKKIDRSVEYTEYKLVVGDY